MISTVYSQHVNREALTAATVFPSQLFSIQLVSLADALYEPKLPRRYS